MRYARHYRIAPERVVAYLENGLKLISLPRAKRMPSYYLGRSGRVHVKMKQFPKGTRVFARADGTPVLSSLCGNPLGTRKRAPKEQTTQQEASSLSEQGATPPAVPSPSTATKAAEGDIETKVLGSPAEFIAGAAVAADPGFVADTTLEMDQMAQLPGAESAALNAGPGVMEAAAPPIPSSFEGIGYAGGLAALVAGLAAAAHSEPSRPNPPPPVVIPEPPGFTALAGLLAVAGALSRRRKARS